MDFAHALGMNKASESPEEERAKLQLYINLKLASSGQPTCVSDEAADFFGISRDLLKSYREKNRLLVDYHCWVDQRIQDFLIRYFDDLDLDQIPTLLTQTLILDRHGVARELSLPMGKDEFHSDIVSSYRVKQGVLHNPASDRRTTKGSFHIAEGGLPIPGDKKAVPKLAFARMLEHALNPPQELLTIPFTSGLPEPARMFASLFCGPSCVPKYPARMRKNPWRSVSLRRATWSATWISWRVFSVMVVTRISRSLTPRWTSTTGPVIPVASFSPRIWSVSPRKSSVCHTGKMRTKGSAQKVCAGSRRTSFIMMATPLRLLLVMSQASLLRCWRITILVTARRKLKPRSVFLQTCSGWPRKSTPVVRWHSRVATMVKNMVRTAVPINRGIPLRKLVERYGDVMDLQPEGYGIDKTYPDIIYVPQRVRMDLNAQTITWHEGR